MIIHNKTLSLWFHETYELSGKLPDKLGYERVYTFWVELYYIDG